jgi:hypothetical protein
MQFRSDDREAIRDLISAYAHAVDRQRWDMMERIFHPDARFQFGTLTGDWRSFVEQARAVVGPCLATQHQLGQVMFGFEGADLCHTETYMTAMHTIPPGYPTLASFPDKGKIYCAIVAGRYIDRMERRAGEWRIANRLLLCDWQEYRESDGIDLSIMPEGCIGMHDDNDVPTVPVVAHWRAT